MQKYVWLLQKQSNNYNGLINSSSNNVIGGIRFEWVINDNSLKVYFSKEEALKGKQNALKRYEKILSGKNLKGYQLKWLQNGGKEIIEREYLELKNEAKLYSYEEFFKEVK